MAGDKTIRDKTINDSKTPLPPEGEPTGEEISKKSPKASKGKSRDHEGPHLYPPEFQADMAFCEALADYYRGRREKRSPATPTAAELISKRLIAAGLDTATKALQTSAANGWTGVFPEKVATAPHGGKPQTGADEPPLALW